ncbi:MAG: ORF6N domain-containing protein [Bacteroidales bacterium]|nr:ORF6N domain-containing protein [Bacteroidales bacterium]
MENLINLPNVNDKIICIRNENVILDSDVAVLYGVETMRINEAVRNNLKKFPKGYVFEINNQEFKSLISKISISSWGGTRKLPKAFTEKGLYMLATILKSDRAIEATIAIVETFAKLKQLTNNIAIINSMDSEIIEPEIIESTGGLFNELFFSGLPTSAETSVEFNIGVMKGKRTIKSENPDILKNTQILQNEIDELKKMIVKMNERLEKM